MQVVNKREFVKEAERIICQKCNADVTNLRAESHRTYSSWRGDDDHRVCSAEEFVICPHCSLKIMLATWDEEF